MAFASALPAVGSAAEQTPTCAYATVNPEVGTLTCPLPAGAASRGHRLTVRFSGSHDDTKAKIDAALDGVPYPCADGSKTSLFAEDGNVSLFCRVAAGAGAGRTLVLTITVTHAQYEGFELARE